MINTNQLERIRGGWAKVPPHLKSKTMLDREGLKPGEPKAEVWSASRWIALYDVAEAVPKRKMTEKQAEALEKGREAARLARTCTECGEFAQKGSRNSQGKYICEWCEERMAEEQRLAKQIDEGEAIFRRWYEQDFLILDTETTGLDGEVVEIGIIDREGRILFESLVKPKSPVSQEAYEIHGLSNEKLEAAPTWSQLWPEISRIVNGRLILTYNADFDSSVMRRSSHYAGIQMPQLDMECIMEAYRLVQGREKWTSLANAAGDWTDHRAVSDCLAALQVVQDQWRLLGLLQSDAYDECAEAADPAV